MAPPWRPVPRVPRPSPAMGWPLVPLGAAWSARIAISVYYLIWGVKVVTKASTANRDQRKFRGFGPWTTFRLALCPLLFLCIGCLSMPWSGLKKADDPAGPADSLVMREGGLERDKDVDGKVQAELDSAKRLYQEKDYAKAEVLFLKIVKTKKTPLPVADDALYYQAACQYYQSNYREAEATLRKYIKEFRTGAHADEANRRLFDIANYWLDDTRKTMQAYEEKREGKRYWIWPTSYVSWSKDKPFMDPEGHAVQCLEDVRLNDIGGPLGEKSLFYIATVKFFHEDYKDADYYYSQLYEHYPNSPLAPKAIKQAIICKQLSTGGSCYDCRAVEESRKLIDVATRAYPQMMTKDQEWISRQLVSVNLQQADRDFNIAEYYRRTKHPGSAYFYYELVIRRYPNTEYAEKSVTRKNEMRDKVVQEQGPAAGDSGQPAGQTTLQRLFSPNSGNSAPAAPQSLPQGLLKS
jgi:outer membrane protein assembly factor BamD (BamD/ComL family)